MSPRVWRSWWPLAAVALLLALSAVAAVHSTPQLSRVERDNGPVRAPRAPDEPERIERTQLPANPPPARTWLAPMAAWLGLVLVAAIVIAGLVIVLRDQLRRRARRGPAPPDPADRSRPDAQDVVAALDAGLVELDDADGDPRRAVIACWVRLERAAAAAGTPRQLADTPTDLVTRLLAGHAVSGAVLAGFASVYREARYATHTVDDEMRAQARAALRRLRAELTAATPAGADPGGADVAGTGPGGAGVAGAGPAGGLRR